MNTNRGSFLAAAGVGAALLATQARAQAAGTYDRTRLDALLHRPAKHRLIIGSPRINFVAALRSSAHIMGGYEFAFGEGPGTVNAVVSLYGPSSIMMLMNDSFWAKSKAYELCAELGDMPPTVVRSAHNPFYKARSTMSLHDSPEDVRGFYHDYTVEAVTKRGVSWLICTEAMHTAARELERLGAGDEAANFEEMKSSLLPGTLIVPSGSMALVIAQELHFTYQAA